MKDEVLQELWEIKDELARESGYSVTEKIFDKTIKKYQGNIGQRGFASDRQKHELGIFDAPIWKPKFNDPVIPAWIRHSRGGGNGNQRHGWYLNSKEVLVIGLPLIKGMTGE